MRKPLYIAGPCSAESFEQLATSFTALDDQVDYLRAGVWKPRTAPNHFEGHGEIALEWLAKLTPHLQSPVMIEVATPQQVELALDYGLHTFWLGARTTVNPIVTQEIAHALKGRAQKVFVKNPVSPDLALWMGAIDRLQQQGLTVAAIHRGFQTHLPRETRNKALWSLPLELKRLRPELELICDPSHLTGKRELIFEYAQKALSFGFDGLMLEVHPNPPAALSDAAQQISLEQFLQLQAQLPALNRQPSEVPQLEEWRDQIDQVDHELLQLLKQRRQIAEQMAQYKNKHQISLIQWERWQDLLQERIRFGKSLAMEEEFIGELFSQIHQQSLEWQHSVIRPPQGDSLEH